VIIAFDGSPLVTRNIAGVEQRARNIISELAAAPLHHQYVLVMHENMRQDQAFDQSFIAKLPDHFRQVWWAPPPTFANRLNQVIGRPVMGHSPADPSWNVFHSFGPTLPMMHNLCTSCTVHDLASELDADVRRAAGAGQKRREIQSAINRSDLVVAVSRQTASDVQAIFQLPTDRIAIIPNGINPIFTPVTDSRIRNTLKDKYHVPQRYALLVGSDIRRRNYRLVMDALAMLFPGEPALRVVFAGRQQWSQSSLYEHIKQMGLVERCVFIDSPTDEELAQLYRDATITICGSSFEGFGLSVLEAAACGCTVACSDMASLRELAEDAVAYFAHDDQASMAEAIKMLLDDVDYRKLLIARGLKRAGQYSWKTAAMRLIGALENTFHQASVHMHM
jgi:glycosyltransferase involved in cell wall biosynthesis